MLKDITIGQYFPGHSLVHGLDPRFKLVITAIYICMLFVTDNIFGLLAGGIFALSAFAVSGIPLKMVWQSLKPILAVLVITAIMNLLFVSGGEVIFEWGIIKVTDEGLNVTVFMIIRILLLVIGSSLLTYTTSPIMLTDAIEQLFSPLKKLKMPVHELAMMMTIALRFIPTLIEETDKITSAQKARGADFETGNLMQRGKALIPVMIPLFVSSFRRAEELATAMTCRCYNGGEGRTRLKQLKAEKNDYIAMAITIVVAVISIWTNFIT